jgi:hypothetical protein
MLKHYNLEHRGAYHPYHLFELNGIPFSPEKLGNIVVLLTEQHVALRTYFKQSSEGNYYQLVRKNAVVELEVSDWSHYEASEVDNKVDSLIKQDVDSQFAPFDASKALMRFKLIKLKDGGSYLYISSHHVVEDGWGFVSLCNTLMDGYKSQEPIETYPIEENSNKEFALLEKQAEQDADLEEYWTQYLSGYDGLQRQTDKVHSCELVDVVRQTFELSEEEINYFTDTSHKNNIQTKSVFLMNYCQALIEINDISTVAVDLVSNGRNEQLSHPLTTPGLFWRFVPYLFEESQDDFWQMQESLNNLEVNSVYPYENLKERFGLHAEFGFNFIQFHNVDDESLSEVTVNRNQDVFHHSLKLTVSLSKDGEEGVLHIERNPSKYSEQDAKDVVQFILRKTNRKIDSLVC